MKTLISALISTLLLSLSASVALAAPPVKEPKILNVDCSKQAKPDVCLISQAAEKKCLDKTTLEEQKACVKAEFLAAQAKK